MDAVDRRVIAEALEGRPSHACLLIAEDAMGHRLGFIHLSEEEDYYAGTCAHVGDIVVTPDARGKGIGRALLERAEAWARERGHRLMSLNVFLRNERARALYEQVGYKPETVRLVKSL
jgi:GNAT superfamily N-acetyltransferase